MSKKRYMGIYYNEPELIERMEELKREGWPEDHMYVIVKDDDQLMMLRNWGQAEIKSANDSWWARFTAFLTGEDHVHRMVENLDFDKADTENYYREIDRGGMLLYVDTGQVNRYYSDHSAYYGTSSDMNLGSNALSVTDQEVNGGDPAYRLSQTLPNQRLRHEHNLGRVGGEAETRDPVADEEFDAEREDL